MKALVLDVETTGLVRNRTLKLDLQPSCIEFYGCIVDLKTGKVSKEFETLIKPPKPLSNTPAPGDKKTIIQITGVTNEMLQDAPSFADVSKTIFKMIEKAPVVIAHNASFDAECLDIEAERLKCQIAWPRKICTVQETVHLKGYRLNQGALYELLFNEPFAGAHRAKNDVMSLVRICIELHKREII